MAVAPGDYRSCSSKLIRTAAPGGGQRGRRTEDGRQAGGGSPPFPLFARVTLYTPRRSRHRLPPLIHRFRRCSQPGLRPEPRDFEPRRSRRTRRRRKLTLGGMGPTSVKPHVLSTQFLGFCLRTTTHSNLVLLRKFGPRPLAASCSLWQRKELVNHGGHGDHGDRKEDPGWKRLQPSTRLAPSDALDGESVPSPCPPWFKTAFSD